MLIVASLTSGVAISQELSHPDIQVIEQLRRHGSDLSKPHPLEFYLYFPSEEEARAAALSMRELQYNILRTELSADGKTWLVLGQKSIVPTQSNVIGSSDQLDAIAASHGGEYDGWESPIIK